MSWSAVTAPTPHGCCELNKPRHSAGPALQNCPLSLSWVTGNIPSALLRLRKGGTLPIWLPVVPWGLCTPAQLCQGLTPQPLRPTLLTAGSGPLHPHSGPSAPGCSLQAQVRRSPHSSSGAQGWDSRSARSGPSPSLASLEHGDSWSSGCLPPQALQPPGQRARPGQPPSWSSSQARSWAKSGEEP